MKIAYITNVKTPSTDAQSVQVYAMAKAFNDSLGDNFIFVSPKTSSNAHIHPAWTWHRISVPLLSIRLVRYVWFIIASFKCVLKFKPDFIFSRDIGVVFVFHFLGFRTAYEMHKPFKNIFGKFCFFIIKNHVRIISISQALKEFIVVTYQLDSNKVLVLHDGVFLENYQYSEIEKKEIRHKLFPSFSNKHIILYSGSFQHGKGVDMFCKAAVILEKNDQLVFVALGGVLDSVCSSNLYFFDRVPSELVSSYLISSDVLVLPNTKNLPYYLFTSPLKLFEYMAAKKPIVASKVGSITEVLNEDSAFLYKHDSVYDLVQQITNAVENKSSADGKVKIAYSLVSMYTWSARVGKLIKFLQT